MGRAGGSGRTPRPRPLELLGQLGLGVGLIRMTLTPEQKTSVSEWVAAGDNLYAVQKTLADQFKVSMTYMDVRFLVDDLNLQLKDPAPKVDTSDVSKGAPAKA